MKYRRRKSLLKGLILAFATAAIVVPGAEASYHTQKAQEARSALNQTYTPQALRALALRSEAMNQQYQSLGANYGLEIRSESINKLDQAQAVRPDDRSGVRGIEPVQSVTDVNAMQRRVELEHIQQLVAADEVASASASSRPDDKAGFRGPGSVDTRSAELASVNGDGFNWKDASIGAGTAIGLTLVLMSGLAVSRRRQSELAV